MTTTTLKRFAVSIQLTTTAAQLATTGSSEKAFIGKVTVTNTSSSNVEVTLWSLATATTETSGSGGNWIYRRTIPAGRTIPIDALIGHALGNSQKISGLASVANVVNINISGTTET